MLNELRHSAGTFGGLRHLRSRGAHQPSQLAQSTGFIDERGSSRIRLPSVTIDENPGDHQRVSLDTIREATTTVYRAAIRTPLVRIDIPEARHAIPEIFLKLETLQPIGSFKIRGAQN